MELPLSQCPIDQCLAILIWLPHVVAKKDAKAGVRLEGPQNIRVSLTFSMSEPKRLKLYR